jgi:hypothetical protein
MQNTANSISANHAAKYRPFGDLGMLDPDL